MCHPKLSKVSIATSDCPIRRVLKHGREGTVWAAACSRTSQLCLSAVLWDSTPRHQIVLVAYCSHAACRVHRSAILVHRLNTYKQPTMLPCCNAHRVVSPQCRPPLLSGSVAIGQQRLSRVDRSLHSRELGIRCPPCAAVATATIAASSSLIDAANTPSDSGLSMHPDAIKRRQDAEARYSSLVSSSVR